MAKQMVSQRYIFKLSSERLKRARWDLKITLAEARQNEEIISIGDSQMLRWIDALNGVTDADERAKEIKLEIRALRKLPATTQNRRKIRKLYDALDAVQFKSDYVHLVIQRDKDLIRACRGFSINGIRYVRLLGTSGGVKNSTVVFVSERLAPELRKRIDNGRNTDVPLVPAKLEAYRALTCSGSTPVSMPNGVLVVPDCETRFKEDVMYITDEGDGEPEMRLIEDYDVTLTESDGYGLMLPSLAERWSDELRLGYTASAMNTRASWEKGMVFTFDFIDFAEKIAGNYIVKDVWGNDIDIRRVELILTASMLKLWNCYDSIDQYLSCSIENGYTFSITKVSPRRLENRRALNYQFIQPFVLTDDQIDQLIQPTIDEIRNVISGDYRRALLFLAGSKLDEKSVLNQSDYVKAIMAEPGMFDDPYIRKKIRSMIAKRINDAKIGVIDVHGNYSILCGDPYALCQSIFGLTVTGLLKAGEVYNQYWAEVGSEYVVCFRAPMSCANNIRKMKIARGTEIEYWYRHIATCTLTNAWDASTSAWNGADKDGDLLMLTDNTVLVNNAPDLPALLCVQRAAMKKNVTEDDLVQANIASFGSDVGKVTNWVTSMYDVQAQFDPESAEYKILGYRIMSGQLYQQNTIDKTKGIVCKPMPRYWHDKAALEKPDDDNADCIVSYDRNLSIVADKKPYFMRYIYPALMKEYNTYIKNTNMKALYEFRVSVDEMLASDPASLSPEQKQFLSYYFQRMPVGINNCVMNRLCRKVEAAFGKDYSESEHEFDYTIMKRGAEYTHAQYNAIERLFKEHNERMRELSARRKDSASNTDNLLDYILYIQEYFRNQARVLCNSDDQLCDIVLDICYRKAGTKQFAWDVASDLIVENLLARSENRLSFPIADPDGDFEYRGDKYSMTIMEVKRNDRDSDERKRVDGECNQQS